MILHHNKLSQSSFIFKKKLKYSDECEFIPIKIKGYTAIQTPLMFIPYGIFTIHNKNKKIIDITFYNLENDTQLNHFKQSLQKIYKVIKNKYKDLNVNPFLKETPFNESLRLKIDSNALFYNSDKQLIENIRSNCYGRFLIQLSGLWVINKEIWVQWILIQGKVNQTIQIKNLLIDEKIISKKIPPPPPLPIFKKSTSKIIIKKKNKTESSKKGSEFEAPTIEELQTILLNLKTIN
jgi:hypothetical protein